VKSFEQVWDDIRRILQNKSEVKTLCKGIKNKIMGVEQNAIIVKSEMTGNERVITKSDFEYVWNQLIISGSINSLDKLSKIRGRRAITCAVLALLAYIEGECNLGRVRLKLKEFY